MSSRFASEVEGLCLGHVEARSCGKTVCGNVMGAFKDAYLESPGEWLR